MENKDGFVLDCSVTMAWCFDDEDAAYLELAIRRGLPLACLDGKLKTAAAAAGVVLFSPP
jgi:hypothetical protein